MRAWLLLFAALALAGEARAAECTDGTDCFCDTLTDARKVLCEDFEALTLWDGRGTGTGGLTGPSGCTVGADPTVANCANNESSPLYGPWYMKLAASSIGRGGASYWRSVLGGAVNPCAWDTGEPASPVLGITCGGAPCWPAEWREDDAWQGNAKACIDIIRDEEDEWDDEVVTDLAPLRPDGTRGGYGHHTYAARNQNGSDGGIHSDFAWGNAEEMGMSFLRAYSTDALSTGILDSPWKHDEFGSIGFLAGTWSDTACDAADDFPFCIVMFIDPGESAACSASAAAATKTNTTVTCSDVSMRINPTSTAYQRSVHWPDENKWGCFRVHYTGVGSSSMGISIRGDFGDGNGERQIILVTGIDTEPLSGEDALASRLKFDNYSNHIAGGGTITHSVRRYMDNLYVRAGSTEQCAGGACDPPTCEEIGFGETGGGEPESAPTYCCKQ